MSEQDAFEVAVDQEAQRGSAGAQGGAGSLSPPGSPTGSPRAFRGPEHPHSASTAALQLHGSHLSGGIGASLSSALSLPALPSASPEGALPGWSPRRKAAAAGWARNIAQRAPKPSSQEAATKPYDPRFLPAWLREREEYATVRAATKAAAAAAAGTHTAVLTHQLLFVKQALQTPSQMRGEREMALLLRWLRGQRRFAHLTHPQLRTVARCMTLSSLPQGAEVREGVAAVYFVLEGAVRIVRWASAAAKKRRQAPASVLIVPPGCGFGGHSGWDRLTARLAEAARKGSFSATSEGGHIQRVLLRAKGAAARLRLSQLGSASGTDGVWKAAGAGDGGSSSDSESSVEGDMASVVQGTVDAVRGGAMARAEAGVERQRMLGRLRRMTFFDPATCEARAASPEELRAVLQGGTAAPMDYLAHCRSQGREADAWRGAEASGPASPPLLAARGISSSMTVVARLGSVEFATAWTLQREAFVKSVLDWLRVSDVTLLADCSQTRLKALAAVVEERVFSPGDVVFKQGDEARCIVLIKSGEADVAVQTLGHAKQSWPVTAASWKVRTVQHAKQRHLGRIATGAVCGHEAVLNMQEYRPAPHIGDVPTFVAVRPADSSPTHTSPTSPTGGFASVVYQKMAVSGAAATDLLTPGAESPGEDAASPGPGSPKLGSPVHTPLPKSSRGAAESAARDSALKALSPGAQRVLAMLAPSRPKHIEPSAHLPSRRAFTLTAHTPLTVLVLPQDRIFHVLQGAAALSRLAVAAEALVWAQWLARRADELADAESGGQDGEVATAEVLSTFAESAMRKRLERIRKRASRSGGMPSLGMGHLSTSAMGRRLRSAQGRALEEDGHALRYTNFLPQPTEAEVQAGAIGLPMVLQPGAYANVVATLRRSSTSREGSGAGNRRGGQWPRRPLPADSVSGAVGSAIFATSPSPSLALARKLAEKERRGVLAACVGDKYGKQIGLVHEGRGHSADMPQWSTDVKVLAKAVQDGSMPSLVGSKSVAALVQNMHASQVTESPASVGSGPRSKRAGILQTAVAQLRGAAAFSDRRNAEVAVGRQLPGEGDAASHSEAEQPLSAYAVSHTPTKYHHHLHATPGQREALTQERAFEVQMAERRRARTAERAARKWRRTRRRGLLLKALSHAKGASLQDVREALNGAPAGVDDASAHKTQAAVRAVLSSPELNRDAAARILTDKAKRHIEGHLGDLQRTLERQGSKAPGQVATPGMAKFYWMGSSPSKSEGRHGKRLPPTTGSRWRAAAAKASEPEGPHGPTAEQQDLISALERL